MAFRRVIKLSITTFSLLIFLHRTLCIPVLIYNQLPVLPPDHSINQKHQIHRVYLPDPDAKGPTMSSVCPLGLQTFSPELPL